MIFEKKYLFVFLAILLVFVSALLYVRDIGLEADEPYNYRQIKRFIVNDYRLDTFIATVPGYHFVISRAAAALGISSPASIRSLSFFFSIFSVLVFFIVSKEIDKNRSIIETLQYSFFCIIFPFFFLIYSEVLSLLLVFLALYFLLKEKYDLAGIFMILNCFIRQNNIVWLFFMFLYIYYDKYDLKFSARIVINFLKHSRVYIVGFLAFMVFVILNKGFAIGDRSMHPPFALHFGNIYFMLFLFFFLFLPLNISNFFKVVELIKKEKSIILLIIILFFVYMVSFANDHPYNARLPKYHIRNILLIYFTSTMFLKALFFIPVSCSILSICVTELYKKSFYLLYPVTLLFLLPVWLIEQRYYLIPFSLFILFKKRGSKVAEYSLLGIHIILSAILLYVIKNDMFFL